jgi:hypothetical protein
VGVAALALLAVALVPSTAGAHCVDGSGLVETLEAELYRSWSSSGDSCANDGRAVQTTAAAPVLAAGAPAKPKSGSFTQVGHNALLNRGMNAAIAIQGDHAYIGSRTDGGHDGPFGGVMVVDISDPSRPTLVGERFDSHPGESSRELRVWRSQNVLIVLNTNCGVGPNLHHCTQASISNIRFYDIAGANAAKPRLLKEFKVDTHEFFLWEDPANPKRALIFAGNAGSSCGIRGGAPSCPFSVWDMSDIRQGKDPVTLYSGPHGYTAFPAPPEPEQKPMGGLHSLTVSNDGRRAYFALLPGGFAVVDTSDFAKGKPFPQPRPVTSNDARPTWAGPGAHSAIKLWGRDWVWVSDEVYGTFTGAGHGCPWGWARMIDISDPSAPAVKGEYRTGANEPGSCEQWNPPRTSYSAHNPTLTPHIAFSTWHSGGLQAVNLQDPARPYQLAEFIPKPLPEVLLEDPRLSSDPDTGHNEKVVMWSYPIIQNGLIYVVDLRNGLYVLKYKGAFEDEVGRIRFLEGNSDQGDALCYEPVGRRPTTCG